MCIRDRDGFLTSLVKARIRARGKASQGQRPAASPETRGGEQAADRTEPSLRPFKALGKKAGRWRQGRRRWRSQYGMICRPIGLVGSGASANGPTGPGHGYRDGDEGPSGLLRVLGWTWPRMGQRPAGSGCFDGYSVRTWPRMGQRAIVFSECCLHRGLDRLGGFRTEGTRALGLPELYQLHLSAPCARDEGSPDVSLDLDLSAGVLGRLVAKVPDWEPLGYETLSGFVPLGGTTGRRKPRFLALARGRSS